MTPLYQLGDDAAFERCLPFTLKEEDPVPSNLADPRNYSNDPRDPGGMTMDGIIQREYDRWRIARELPTRWVNKIDADEVRTIYHDDYWLPYCPKCPAGLDLCLFDANVNNGTHAGKVLLQRALGIAADGEWGPQTEAAVAGLKNSDRAVRTAIMAYYSARRAYYMTLRGFHTYGKDWLYRDLHIEQAALGMVAA